jgi:hypothetical protein
MTLAATAAIYVALYVLSRLFPTGAGDVISPPIMRAGRLFILVVVHLLGVSLYAVAVIMGLLGESLRVLVYSFVPILGQVFWIQSSWWSGPFLTEYAIAFAAWLVLVVLAFVTGAFKERLAPPAPAAGAPAPDAPVQN